MFKWIKWVRLDWSKRRRILEKVAKYSGKLSNNFLEKKTIAQQVGYDLHQAGQEGIASQTRLYSLMNNMQTVISAAGNVAAYFNLYVADARRIEYNYKIVIAYKKEIPSLKRMLAEHKELLSKQKALGREKRDEGDSRSLELEIKSVQERLSNIEGTIKTKTEIGEKAEQEFIEDREDFYDDKEKAIKLIQMLLGDLKMYDADLEQLGKEPNFKKLVGSLKTKDTEELLKKLRKWLRRFTRV